MEQHYYSGEEIHIGDRVEFCGCPGVIILVIDREEWPDDQSLESRAWFRAEYGSGFVIRQDAGAEIVVDGADEDLFFVSRATNVA